MVCVCSLSLTLGEDEETDMNSVAQTAPSSCASLIALLEAIEGMTIRIILIYS